jgi:hypothetical protein
LKTRPMIAHCVLILLTLALSICFMVETIIKLSSKFELDVLALIPLGDLFVQLLIIYITWTQGLDEQLKSKDCVVVEGVDGHLKLIVRDLDLRQTIESMHSSIPDLVSEY